MAASILIRAEPAFPYLAPSENQVSLETLQIKERRTDRKGLCSGEFSLFTASVMETVEGSLGSNSFEIKAVIQLVSKTGLPH